MCQKSSSARSGLVMGTAHRPKCAVQLTHRTTPAPSGPSGKSITLTLPESSRKDAIDEAERPRQWLIIAHCVNSCVTTTTLDCWLELPSKFFKCSNTLCQARPALFQNSLKLSSPPISSFHRTSCHRSADATCAGFLPCDKNK